MYLIFGGTVIFLQQGVGWVEGSSHAKTSSIRSSVSIELRLVTDRQTDRHRHRHRHGAVAGTRASIASPRGKNDISTIYCAEINAFSAYTFSDMTLLVGRQGGHPACKKQWWGAGVVLYLEQGADLHMAPCS